MECPYTKQRAKPAESREPSGFERVPHEHVTRRQFLTKSALALAGATMYACTGGTKVPMRATESPASSLLDTQWPIKRAIYLMLENRSFDHLFGKYPGANGTTIGLKEGKEVPLIRAPEWLPGDLPHDLAAFLNCLDEGKLDGFDTGIYGPVYSYSQFDGRQLPNYYTWADDYVLCDNFFASEPGPSYGNHLFFIAGQSGGVIDNPENIQVRWEGNKKTKSWGCDAYGDDVFVFVKDDHGNLMKHDTCFDFRTVPQQLSEAGVDWAYYAATKYQPGYFWNALNVVGPIFHTDVFHEHARPVDNLVDDIKANKLPAVTWVTPRFELSDHPPFSTFFAQNWVTDIVNAVMQSDMWEQTALFVTWDEWGGLYDHVMPPSVDGRSLGFRVPMLVISPYAKKGYVDDAQGEFSTPLRFISDNWGLEYLTPRIAKTHNFEHVFDFKRNPRTDAKLLGKVKAYGDPFHFPENYPGWVPGTVPTDNPI